MQLDHLNEILTLSIRPIRVEKDYPCLEWQLYLETAATDMVWLELKVSIGVKQDLLVLHISRRTAKSWQNPIDTFLYSLTNEEFKQTFGAHLPLLLPTIKTHSNFRVKVEDLLVSPDNAISLDIFESY